MNRPELLVPNQFDNLCVDVDDLYDRHPVGGSAGPGAVAPSGFEKLYGNRWLPLSWRTNAWTALRRSNVDWSWFEEFRSYWTRVLGGRPLWSPHDLFFLKNQYRLRFQHVEVPDLADSESHVAAWQTPDVLYQLLDLVHRQAFANRLSIAQRVLPHVGEKNARVLEYGSAIGPVTQTLREFNLLGPESSFLLCDIKTLAFHFANYRFGGASDVTTKLLQPEDNLQLKHDGALDLIFCITVFEHLNSPLETMQNFHALLNDGGVLAFDYIKGDGDGLDTAQGVEQRDAVLKFTEENFEVLGGNLDTETSTSLTIVRKKAHS